MDVVLDTNVLLVSISRKSKFNWIFLKLIQQEYNLFVTTDILMEYAEILERHMGQEVSENVLNTLVDLPNLFYINSYYKFNLLKDSDDNKFVDCAIAANASFIVTRDKDFRILESITFPSVPIIDPSDFKTLFSK